MGELNLPREVLRWVQSLDLAYSVKNVKRDFSNGFLVAEIFSRYYAKEFQMHSYDNGNSTKTKKDNWAQLIKAFRKIGHPELLNEADAHLILCCEEGNAVTFISKIYEVLTQRKVQNQIKNPTVGKVAGYSKETGLAKVRAALKRADLRDENSDMLSVARVASVVVDSHERDLQDDRSVDPDRYSSSSINLRTTQQAPKSAADLDDTGPQVRVKEIQVKQIDRNVTHLRASKSNNATASAGGGSPIRSGNNAEGFASPSMANLPTGPSSTLAENSTSVLNSCIGRIMGPENHPSWSMNADPTQNYLTALDYLRLGGEDMDALLAEVIIMFT